MRNYSRLPSGRFLAMSAAFAFWAVHLLLSSSPAVAFSKIEMPAVAAGIASPIELVHMGSRGYHRQCHDGHRHAHSRSPARIECKSKKQIDNKTAIQIRNKCIYSCKEIVKRVHVEPCVKKNLKNPGVYSGRPDLFRRYIYKQCERKSDNRYQACYFQCVKQQSRN